MKMMYELDTQMENIDLQEERIIAALGVDGALDAITRALSYEQKESIYRFIIRSYDIEDE